MLIPTAVGTNSLGHVGPSTSRWILPLDIDEVSTIVDGTLTQQLTLSDLGTDCPQTADPTAIATLVDPRCDPILAAPKQVSSWAYPCNACGNFGLFDPPYAIPTLPGGLFGSTTVVPAKTVATSSAASTPPVGAIVVVDVENGTPVATATMVSTGMSGTRTSSVQIAATSTTTPTSETASTQGSETLTSSAPPSSTTPSTTPSTVATAPAARVESTAFVSILTILSILFLA